LLGSSPAIVVTPPTAPLSVTLQLTSSRPSPPSGRTTQNETIRSLAPTFTLLVKADASCKSSMNERKSASVGNEIGIALRTPSTREQRIPRA
jgi:hypothetical protein